MKDRFGKPLALGWSAVEEIYIRAAMSLTKAERPAAYQDIADMTGRTKAAICSKADRMLAAGHDAGIRSNGWRYTPKQFVPPRATGTPHRPTMALPAVPVRMEPSAIPRPSDAARMAGNARRVKAGRFGG